MQNVPTFRGSIPYLASYNPLEARFSSSQNIIQKNAARTQHQKSNGRSAFPTKNWGQLSQSERQGLLTATATKSIKPPRSRYSPERQSTYSIEAARHLSEDILGNTRRTARHGLYHTLSLLGRPFFTWTRKLGFLLFIGFACFYLGKQTFSELCRLPSDTVLYAVFCSSTEITPSMINQLKIHRPSIIEILDQVNDKWSNVTERAPYVKALPFVMAKLGKATDEACGEIEASTLSSRRGIVTVLYKYHNVNIKLQDKLQEFDFHLRQTIGLFLTVIKSTTHQIYSIQKASCHEYTFFNIAAVWIANNIFTPAFGLVPYKARELPAAWLSFQDLRAEPVIPLLIDQAGELVQGLTFLKLQLNYVRSIVKRDQVFESGERIAMADARGLWTTLYVLMGYANDQGPEAVRIRSQLNILAQFDPVIEEALNQLSQTLQHLHAINGDFNALREKAQTQDLQQEHNDDENPSRSGNERPANPSQVGTEKLRAARERWDMWQVEVWDPLETQVWEQVQAPGWDQRFWAQFGYESLEPLDQGDRPEGVKNGLWAAITSHFQKDGESRHGSPNYTAADVPVPTQTSLLTCVPNPRRQTGRFGGWRSSVLTRHLTFRPLPFFRSIFV